MRTAILIALAACGTNATPQPAPVPTLPSCVPNLDGQITAGELPIALGATLPYYSANDRAVDLVLHDGRWDLSSEQQGDAASVVALGPVALGAQYYASQFPGGAFVVDAGAGLDAIYHQDDRALWLDGTASHDASGGTLVRYAEAVALLRFPLADGVSYTETGALPAAKVDGLPFVGADTFMIDVSGPGELAVPYVDFSRVLRVRTQLARTPSTGSPVVTKRTTSFVFECFGEVARADSRLDEPNPDFTTAATLRRFALGE